MWEFDICNLETGKMTIIMGYDFYDACRRWGLDPSDWEVLGQSYVD